MDQELVQYLDERFGRIEQRLDRHDQRFEQIDRRFEQIDGRFDEVNVRIEEVKRHSGVLVEGLRHELQLVAEGFAMHIQVQHVQEREYHDRQHQETRTLIRSFADDLRQQQDHLRHRVENLERPKPN